MCVSRSDSCSRGELLSLIHRQTTMMWVDCFHFVCHSGTEGSEDVGLQSEQGFVPHSSFTLAVQCSHHQDQILQHKGKTFQSCETDGWMLNKHER